MVDNVKVIFKRKKSIIIGKNILLKTLDEVRACGLYVPPLDIELSKGIPPGTGAGAASGDAAALLLALKESGIDALSSAAAIGSDVPFFCSSSRLALVRGTGELITPLPGDLPFVTVLVIPEWRCMTPDMYVAADRHYSGSWPVDEAEAGREASLILGRLKKCERCGLLPNDFAAVLLEEHKEYRGLFELFERRGAIAWGITGSGSAAFALWSRSSFSGFDHGLPWIEDFIIFY